MDEVMRHGGNVWQGQGPGSWLDYSANLRPEGMFGWTRACLEQGVDSARYYPELSMSASRASLSRLAGVDEACVLPTAGGIAAIDMACMMARGRVLIMPPTFGEYVRRARAHGMDTGVYVGEGSRAWGRLDACAEFGGVTDELRAGDALFLCNPNNPSGEALERVEVLRLLDMAKAQGARLIVDEAFVDYCPEISVRDAAARDAALTVVCSLTKILCVPGARLGYMVAAPEVIARAQALALPWALNSGAGRIAGQVCLHMDDMESERIANDGRRARMEEGLMRMGVQVIPSRANFLLVRLPVAARVVAAGLKQHGILTRDCTSFGVLDERYMRLAVKTDDENARLLEALSAELQRAR